MWLDGECSPLCVRACVRARERACVRAYSSTSTYSIFIRNLRFTYLSFVQDARCLPLSDSDRRHWRCDLDHNIKACHVASEIPNTAA